MQVLLVRIYERKTEIDLSLVPAHLSRIINDVEHTFACAIFFLGTVLRTKEA
jgi:hypothetical protein